MNPQKALEFAQDLHRGQKRKTGEDYVEHPMRVSKILKTFDLSEEIIIAGILHDICEKTTADYDEVHQTFGQKMKEMIHALSKEKPAHETTQQHLENYRDKLHRESHKHPGILLVKMADQIDNLQSLFVFPAEDRARKVKEIRELFLPVYQEQSENCPNELKLAFNILIKQLVKNLEKVEQNLILLAKFKQKKQTSIPLFNFFQNPVAVLN